MQIVGEGAGGRIQNVGEDAGRGLGGASKMWGGGGVGSNIWGRRRVVGGVQHVGGSGRAGGEVQHVEGGGGGVRSRKSHRRVS